MPVTSTTRVYSAIEALKKEIYVHPGEELFLLDEDVIRERTSKRTLGFDTVFSIDSVTGELKLDSYFTGAEPPTSEDLSGAPLWRTFWFSTSTGVVLALKARDESGKGIWVESELYIPKLILNPITGEVIGEVAVAPIQLATQKPATQKPAAKGASSAESFLSLLDRAAKS